MMQIFETGALVVIYHKQKCSSVSMRLLSQSLPMMQWCYGTVYNRMAGIDVPTELKVNSEGGPMMWIRSLVAVPQLMSTSDVPPGTVASKTGGEQPTISRWILTLSISHSNYISPACKPGLHRVLLMLGRVNVGGCWLLITYCRLSCVHHFNCTHIQENTVSLLLILWMWG